MRLRATAIPNITNPMTNKSLYSDTNQRIKKSIETIKATRDSFMPILYTNIG